VARKTTSKRPARRSAAARPRRRKKTAIAIPDCKRFTGYKPCFPQTRCYEACVNPDPIGTRILVVNLDAMGNVLVTTSILPSLKRKYPVSRIYWITLKNAYKLIENNPYLDGAFVWEPESWLVLQQMQFDLVLNVDKSQRSGALTMTLDAKEKLGFGMDKNGVIIPLNPEAEPNYILGLDDHLKFRMNKKPVAQMLCEQFKLGYRRDEYSLVLSDSERAFCDEYRKQVGLSPIQAETRELVVGFNTGCSELFPNKKMTTEQHVSLINRLSAIPGIRLVLVGGPEDTMRNAEIVRQVGEKVISTPTTEGVRRGLCYINLCDVVISGDSFGMHAAVALKKQVIVWFGVSSAAEIDLYERGIKLVPHGLECSPCWKRACPYNLECIAMIDQNAIVREVERTHAKGLV
jgi:ADP-heptose:LPS heptosyltransferase